MKTRPDLHLEALLAQHMFFVQICSTSTLRVFVMIFTAMALGAENQRNSHIVLRAPQMQSKVSLCNPGILPSNSNWNMGMDMYKQPRQHEARLRILKWMHETGAAGTAEFSNMQSKLWKHLTTIRMSLDLIRTLLNHTALRIKQNPCKILPLTTKQQHYLWVLNTKVRISTSGVI